MEEKEGVTLSQVSLSTAAADNKGKKWCLYDSKHHDVHHLIPQCRDRIFSTFCSTLRDRVNPAYPLDIGTGRTVESVKME